MLLRPEEVIVDAERLYDIVRRGWLGYLSLLDIDLPRLMTCPEAECEAIQGDG